MKNKYSIDGHLKTVAGCIWLEAFLYFEVNGSSRCFVVVVVVVVVDCLIYFFLFRNALDFKRR